MSPCEVVEQEHREVARGADLVVGHVEAHARRPVVA
jgi:K+-sensing histidine kinase KdpD